MYLHRAPSRSMFDKRARKGDSLCVTYSYMHHHASILLLVILSSLPLVDVEVLTRTAPDLTVVELR